MAEIELQEPTVGEALARLGLEAGFMDQAAHGRWWHFEVLGFRIPCYNFAWRREALAFHDLHHVITAYPCTMRGEMQVAAWEFAAGRCPSLAANFFCLPLLALGNILIPAKTYRAFRDGSARLSLYGRKIGPEVKDMPVAALRTLTARDSPQAATVLRFALWSLASFTLLVAPLAAGWWLLF